MLVAILSAAAISTQIIATEPIHEFIELGLDEIEIVEIDSNNKVTARKLTDFEKEYIERNMEEARSNALTEEEWNWPSGGCINYSGLNTY